jgi:hypothetical protein
MMTEYKGAGSQDSALNKYHKVLKAETKDINYTEKIIKSAKQKVVGDVRIEDENQSNDEICISQSDQSSSDSLDIEITQ